MNTAAFNRRVSTGGCEVERRATDAREMKQE